MYQINTPGPCFTVPTLADAKRKARLGLRRAASKRGYTLKEFKERRGRTTYHYFHVLNSKGRVVTGCVIYKIA